MNRIKFSITRRIWINNLSEVTKQLITDHGIELYELKESPTDRIGAFSVPVYKIIYLCKEVLEEPLDVLEAILLHEIGHILNPLESCHIRIDRFVVDKGFGSGLCRSYHSYLKLNNLKIHEVPHIRYRMNSIRNYIKGLTV